MNKIELLAPAKDLVKAKIAIDYGADAVYVGGKNFSLRSRASNFSNEDIKEIVNYAHGKNAKVYVTVNIIFHDEDFKGIKEYLMFLEETKVDAIIVSSMAVVRLLKKYAPSVEAHISTQLSTTNLEAVKTLATFGADRVVLARECSMEDISIMAESTDMPLEVFIHGGMCSNYSGRCTLSNRMTNRDANRGGCAHSCRWKYHVFENGQLLSDAKIPFSMSSKDLCAVQYIEEMIKCGVASLKIEGRMKSEYYLAQVVKTYRNLIDEIYVKGHLTNDRIEYYYSELQKAENRPSGTGFLSGTCDNSNHLYDVNGAGVTHDYVALVLGYDPNRSLALIEVKNEFDVDDKLEVFGPDLNNEIFVNRVMFDLDWENVEQAHKPTQKLYLRIPFAVKRNYMIRKA